MSSSNLYQREELLEHMKHPCNYGEINNSSLQIDMVNRSCGDELVLYVLLENNVVKDIKFNGDACGVAVASASMLTESVKGRSIKDLSRITKDDVLGNFNGTLTSSRIPCALLIYDGIKKIYKTHENKE